nr:hypothetical protein [Tanacetum cinerariifolium]
MKCCNEKCGRAFTCVEIDKPLEEVLSDEVGASGTKVSGSEFVEISDDDDDDKVEKKVEVKKEEEEMCL